MIGSDLVTKQTGEKADHVKKSLSSKGATHDVSFIFSKKISEN